MYRRGDGWYSEPGVRPPRNWCGTLVVVEGAEPVEGALLGDQVILGWSRRRSLERSMHPLVGPVLLGTGGQNPLVLNAQPYPPYVELREAVDADGGERHAVVDANSPGQPVLAKEAIEEGADALAPGREQAVTAEQVARVLVRDRQRIAVDTVAGPEVAFEVRSPEVIRPGRRGRHDPGVGVATSAATLLDQPPPGQAVARRARGRQLQLGVPPLSASAGSCLAPNSDVAVGHHRSPPRHRPRSDADSDEELGFARAARPAPPARTARATCSRSSD